MDTLQEQLYTTYNISIDARKKYEEELKRTYVLEKKIADIEEEIRSLRVVTRPVREAKVNHEAQNEANIAIVGEPKKWIFISGMVLRRWK